MRKVTVGADVKIIQERVGSVAGIYPVQTDSGTQDDNTLDELQQGNRTQRLQPRAMFPAARNIMVNTRSHQEGPSGPLRLARSSATISCAASLAASCWLTSNDIAPTR